MTPDEHTHRDAPENTIGPVEESETMEEEYVENQLETVQGTARGKGSRKHESTEEMNIGAILEELRHLTVENLQLRSQCEKSEGGNKERDRHSPGYGRDEGEREDESDRVEEETWEAEP